MKMFFSDEEVEVTAPYCGTWNVSKQAIADFLVLKHREELANERSASLRRGYYPEDGVLEKTVILSNLINVSSIEIKESDIIKLDPIGIRMLVSEYIIEFLRSKSKYPLI